MEIEKEMRRRIRIWLLNGVTFREVVERCGWLGVTITEEQIKEIAENTK